MSGAATAAAVVNFVVGIVVVGAGVNVDGVRPLYR